MGASRNIIDSILHDATGKRASGREYLVSQKKSILDEQTSTLLKSQWNSAGRDNARVAMRLTDIDGNNPVYVTGWDGRDTFVCMTEAGLSYVDYRKIEKLKFDSDWDSNTRLIEVRAPLLRENMERADIENLLKRLGKTLTKSGKARRRGRLRNMEKFFVSEDSEAKKTPGGKSGTEFVKITKKDDRAPSEDPPGRNEAICWDVVDAAGHVVRRPLNHPWMESNKTEPQIEKRQQVSVAKEGGKSSAGATPAGNKTDPQLKDREQVTVRSEDAQGGKRTLVNVRGEGKGSSSSATPGGNKTDPQLNKRQHVSTARERGASRSLRQECAATDSSDKSDKPEPTTYTGEKVKDKEFSSRPKIAVRHESLSLKKKAQKLFGPGATKKSPEGAKKPLLMLVLMTKKRPMSEATVRCPNCHKHHTTNPFGPDLGDLPGATVSQSGAIHDPCPTCAAMRERTGGGLKLKSAIGPGPMPPSSSSSSRKPSRSSFESRQGRSSLRLAEAKRPLHPSFLANIQKMKDRAKARREAASCSDCA